MPLPRAPRQGGVLRRDVPFRAGALVLSALAPPVVVGSFLIATGDGGHARPQPTRLSRLAASTAVQRADVPAAATPRVVLRRFPSASCAFAYPDGWQVVWADLDRGSTWYNAARAPGATADTVTCTVPKAARPTQVVIGNGGSTAGTPVFVVAAPRPWTHSISLGQGVTLAVDRTVAAVGAGPALRLTDVLSPGVRICPDVPEQRRVCGS